MPGDWPLSTNLPTQESRDVSSSPGPGVDGGFGQAAGKAKPSLPQQPDSISAPQIPPDPVFQSLFFISISCKKLPQLPWFLKELLPSSFCPTFPGSWPLRPHCAPTCSWLCAFPWLCASPALSPPQASAPASLPSPLTQPRRPVQGQFCSSEGFPACSNPLPSSVCLNAWICPLPRDRPSRPHRPPDSGTHKHILSK